MATSAAVEAGRAPRARVPVRGLFGYTFVVRHRARLREGLRIATARYAAAVAFACCAAACGGELRVARVVDGRVVTGEYIDAAGYAAFMRGAIAEERGDAREALGAYKEVAERGEDDPELWTRIATLRCTLDPHDREADAALGRAFKLDASYGPAWAAKARCALSRGEAPVAADDARRGVLVDPTAAEPQVLLAQALMRDEGGDLTRRGSYGEEARARLEALTLRDGTSASWDALAAWGRGHSDAALVAHALARVALLAPSRRAELGQRAEELAGEGELAAARRLAAAVVDAPGDRSSGGLGPAAASSPLVARLAIDEALLAHDGARATERASRAHLGLDVVAGRALALGEATIAKQVATLAVEADPRAAGARLVLAALGRQPGAVAGALHVEGAVAAEALLPLARLVARVGSPEAARSLVQQILHTSVIGGDAALTAIAVELAAASVLPDAELPPDARIELAARRLETPDSALLGKVDARHRLFALALTHPLDSAAADLAQHLAPSAGRDPLIALALVRLALARGTSVDVGVIDRLVAGSPADPLVALAALDVARKRGDERAIAPARARLTALARTPGELAHAAE